MLSEDKRDYKVLLRILLVRDFRTDIFVSFCVHTLFGDEKLPILSIGDSSITSVCGHLVVFVAASVLWTSGSL